ncbi:SsrA-binding protein SmpB [Candidatus Nomurabacteria bacterium]|uniref:SsrA-binding protein n=1 Tax=Candidatus Dojkabacteria bacterium TaxID=2099670 RepID=A0A955I213_9BACT|nr:SsrA-binding protein SmpB [Candidatus Dojkabacteria bacterium]MCB9789461.1 SsrA-binding protein SmpB [Candidatus Nomurabacteria bacterium]MCB9803783.1 SsrA-binding protein SmpB [Candidatus Nomurabacteria bacterium]
MGIKLITKNKKAYFNYEIKEKYEAGIQLLGSEVKAIKSGQVNISDSFVKIIGGEAFLWNADIPKYKYATVEGYDPFRSRKLLLKRAELRELQRKAESDRMTIVPLSVFLARGMVKLEIGLGKGKRSYEKKKRIKERDLERELHRERRSFMVK